MLIFLKVNFANVFFFPAVLLTEIIESLSAFNFSFLAWCLCLQHCRPPDEAHPPGQDSRWSQAAVSVDGTHPDQESCESRHTVADKGINTSLPGHCFLRLSCSRCWVSESDTVICGVLVQTLRRRGQRRCGGSCLSMWAEAAGGILFSDTILYPAMKMLALSLNLSVRFNISSNTGPCGQHRPKDEGAKYSCFHFTSYWL